MSESDEVAEVKRRVRALTLRLICGKISDQEEKLIIEELDRIVPDPAYRNYVFYSKEMGSDSEIVDKAIEKAFQYKSIIL
jgi:hypothetical protein